MCLCCCSVTSCLTLCDPTDGSPPGSPVPRILQARILEWVAISFSNAWKWKVKVKSLSRVRLFATSWAAAYQAPPPMGFSRQEYWSGVPLPSLCPPGNAKVILDMSSSTGFQTRVKDWATLQHQLSGALVSSLLIWRKPRRVGEVCETPRPPTCAQVSDQRFCMQQ